MLTDGATSQDSGAAASAAIEPTKNSLLSLPMGIWCMDEDVTRLFLLSPRVLSPLSVAASPSPDPHSYP